MIANETKSILITSTTKELEPVRFSGREYFSEINRRLKNKYNDIDMGFINYLYENYGIKNVKELNDFYIKP